ncbi:MAG: protein kinase [Chitinophagales bacterium]
MSKKGKRIIPKIADFGISKNALGDNTNDSTKLIGTVEYMAPEQFNPKFAIENKPHYNLDLWALGVMLFELLSGQPPFGKRSQTTHSEQIMHNICYEQIPNKFENIDEPFRTVLNRCLVKDANKRARSASELIDIIINYKDDKVDEKVNVASKNQLNKKLNRSLERKEINTTSSKGKKIKGIILVLFLIFLGVASYFLFNKGSKVVVNSNKSFRNYIDLADKESGLMTLIYLDTALLYLDSSYTAYEFGDSIQEPRVLNEVLEEIKNKKLKATDNLKEEEIELRALDILTIESSFDGWEEINKVWLEEVFKLNQN